MCIFYRYNSYTYHPCTPDLKSVLFQIRFRVVQATIRLSHMVCGAQTHSREYIAPRFWWKEHTFLGLMAQIKCGPLDAKSIFVILEEILGFCMNPGWNATPATSVFKCQLTIQYYFWYKILHIHRHIWNQSYTTSQIPDLKPVLCNVWYFVKLFQIWNQCYGMFQKKGIPLDIYPIWFVAPKLKLESI